VILNKPYALLAIFVFILTPLSAVSVVFEPAQSQEAQRPTQSPAITTIASVSNSFLNETSDSQQTAIQNETVNYYNNNSGYLVYPISNQNQNQKNTTDASATTQVKLPGIIMIHENRGLNENIKDSADILARQGYVVLAVDLFGEVTADPDRARELSSAVRNNPSPAIENMKSAVRYLGTLDNVNASRIASIGWCFGGAQSLQLALNSEDQPLAATIIYYGRLVNDTTELSKIKWPVLGIFGDQDDSISVDSVKAFGSGLNETGVTNEIYIYPGVGHAFANPSNDNYAPAETADAWRKTLEFLKKYV
jgi:carboxymethylenebutenolidase